VCRDRSPGRTDTTGKRSTPPLTVTADCNPISLTKILSRNGFAKMAVIRVKGLASATKTLADGKKQKYWYAWRGGPVLLGRDGKPAVVGTTEFMEAYNKAVAERRAPASGTMFNVIARYRGSAEFQKLADKTRKDYARYLKLIEEKFGTLPLAAAEMPKARGVFKDWRDTMADKPRTADYAWTMLARLLSFAKDRGDITINVCEKGGRLYEADRAEKIWTAPDILRFKAAASPELWHALMMALWTGQREGDLLRLSWKAYDGACLRLRQGKSREYVTIPVGEPLRLMLDALRDERRSATTILTNARHQKPWTQDGFRTSWGKACFKAKVTGLTFHDLRGTAVTRLAVAGCTVPEIASITGHALEDVQAILDAHYLGGRIELAEAAMVKLVSAYGSGT